MKILGKFPTTRLRRVRNSDWVRRLVSENNLSTNDLILPVFIREGKNKIDSIKSMPEVYRYSINRLPEILQKISFLNPFFHMIDGLRFSFIGSSDGSIKFGLIYLFLFSLIIWFISFLLYKKGYKIRN